MAATPTTASLGSKVWQILDNPIVWETSRIGLDLTFRLYTKRIAMIRRWGLLEGAPSILDIGCGIGQYSTTSTGTYVGVDLNERYVEYAQRRRGNRPNTTFRQADVSELLGEKTRFDLVLMVDFLHHIPDAQCVAILDVASKLAKKAVVSFEPITHQPNPVGRWIVEHDRGDFVRPLDRLQALFERAGVEVAESLPLQVGPINTRATRCLPKAGRDT